MTPKEKAQELYEKTGGFNKQTIGLNKGSFSIVKAVNIAMITVDEIIQEYENKIISGRPSHFGALKNYWIEVKNELINKIK